MEQVKQIYYEVADTDRPSALEGLLRQAQTEPVTQALVFRRTKAGVDRLVKLSPEAELRRPGHPR